jgi:hypothetical protein
VTSKTANTPNSMSNEFGRTGSSRIHPSMRFCTLEPSATGQIWFQRDGRKISTYCRPGVEMEFDTGDLGFRHGGLS